MFALIESCPEQRPSFGWTGKLASLIIHAFLISAALALTEHVVAAPAYHPVVTDIFVTPHVPVPVSASAPVGDPAPSIVIPTNVRELVVPVTVPTDIPVPGVAPIIAPGSGGDPLPGIHPPGDPGIVAPDAPRDVRFVEDLPELVSHPELRYPEILRQAGIEGRVLVEAVLDTLGRAEPAATHVVAGANDLFNQEALRVVLASRYRAARANGRAVRVRVQVPVNFSIAR